MYTWNVSVFALFSTVSPLKVFVYEYSDTLGGFDGYQKIVNSFRDPVIYIGYVDFSTFGL